MTEPRTRPVPARARRACGLAAAICTFATLACGGAERRLTGNTVAGTVTDALDSKPAAGVVVQLFALAPGSSARLLDGCRRQDSVEKQLVAHQGDIYPKTINSPTVRERAHWQQLWDSDNANRGIGWHNLDAEIEAASRTRVAIDTTEANGRYQLVGVPSGEYLITVMGNRELLTVPTRGETPLAFIDRRRVAELRSPNLRASRPDVCPNLE